MSNGVEWVVGLKVKVTTLLDHVITGKIYTYDAQTNTVTLEESENGGDKPSYRIIKTSFIREAQVLEKPKKNGQLPPGGRVTLIEKAEPSIGYVSSSAASRKESTAIHNAIRTRSTKGVGVSSEAQTIFDAIFKTIPCRWYEKSIIVVDEVRIDPPYTAESCLADDPKSKSLDLVQKIITGTREKLKLEVRGG